MNKIKEMIFTISHPSYWLMNNKYSKEWDIKLNQLAKEHKFEYIDKYSCKLGNNIIWIANHPYASFTPETTIRISNVRPSRLTIHKLYSQYLSDIL